MTAAWTNYPEIVNILLKYEEAMQDEDGWTALMCAAVQGHVEPLKLLLPHEKGMQKKDGWTALMLAANNSHAEATRLLMTCPEELQASELDRVDDRGSHRRLRTCESTPRSGRKNRQKRPYCVDDCCRKRLARGFGAFDR